MTNQSLTSNVLMDIIIAISSPIKVEVTDYIRGRQLTSNGIGMCFFLDNGTETLCVTNYHVVNHMLNLNPLTTTKLLINGTAIQKKNIYCDSHHDIAIIPLNPGKIQDIGMNLSHMNLCKKILDERTWRQFVMDHQKNSIISKELGYEPVFTMFRYRDVIKFCHGYIKKTIRCTMIQRMNGVTFDTVSRNQKSKILVMKIENVEQGFSGAPIINYSGEIVGMIFAGRGDECTGLSIETVRECIHDISSGSGSGSGPGIPISKL
jgi:hypothetical protein